MSHSSQPPSCSSNLLVNCAAHRSCTIGSHMICCCRVVHSYSRLKQYASSRNNTVPPPAYRWLGSPLKFAIKRAAQDLFIPEIYPYPRSITDSWSAVDPREQNLLVIMMTLALQSMKARTACLLGGVDSVDLARVPNFRVLESTGAKLFTAHYFLRPVVPLVHPLWIAGATGSGPPLTAIFCLQRAGMLEAAAAKF